MADTFGDLIDKLSIANIRLWHIEDSRREFTSLPPESQDVGRATELLNMVSAVNKERNSLIDQINRSIRALTNPENPLTLTREEILGTGKQKLYSGEHK